MQSSIVSVGSVSGIGRRRGCRWGLFAFRNVFKAQQQREHERQHHGKHHHAADPDNAHWVRRVKELHAGEQAGRSHRMAG